MEGIVSLLPLIFIGAVFYFLLIRPQRTRQRQQQEMQSQLRPGQRVMTTAGLFATVIAVDDDGVALEIAPGVTSRWARGAVSRVLPDDSEPADLGSAPAGTDVSSAYHETAGPTGSGPESPTGSAPEPDQKSTKDSGGS